MTSVSATIGRQRVDPVQAAAYAGIGLIVGVFAYFAFSTEGFMAADNLRSVLAQSAYVGVFAVATAVIMISGNLFSLSLSTTGAVTATAFLALLPHGVWPALILTVVLGAAIFGVQGLLVGAFGANPIIVTIAAGGLQEGVFLWWSGGGTTTPPPGSTDWQFLTNRYDMPLIGELPLAVFILFGLVVVLELVMRRTRFGRALYLVGENREAATAAGLPTAWIIVGAFVLAGTCVGLAGVELGAFNGSGSLLVGSTFTYDAIAAAVVGGVAITGGKGRIWQALAGAVFIQAVSGILLLRGYSQGDQIFVKGLIVVVTVFLMWLINRRSER